MAMQTAPKATNPISDLMYDWLTVLQSKAEGLNAYEKYIQDARAAGATDCAKLFQKLQKQDAKQAEEIRDHLKMMMSKEG